MRSSSIKVHDLTIGSPKHTHKRYRWTKTGPQIIMKDMSILIARRSDVMGDGGPERKFRHHHNLGLENSP